MFKWQNSLIIALFFFGLLTSCQNSSTNLKLVKVEDSGYAHISDEPIIKLFKTQANIEAELAYTVSEDSALNWLEEESIDLAIMTNGVDPKSDVSKIRTLIALLPRLLLIVYRPGIEQPNSLNELLTGRNVGFESLDWEDKRFFKEFFTHFGINQEVDFNKVLVDSVNIKRQIEQQEVDVFISLTHFRNELFNMFLENKSTFFSVDDPSLFQRGSNVEGFCLSYPEAYPFIIPKATFQNMPQQPIVTVAVRDMLVCNESLPDALAYIMVETLAENKTLLTQDDKIYGLLDFEYTSSNASFTFPLHDGTVDYLNKDEPSFLERYARVVASIFSILVVLFGVFMQGRNMMRRRRKEKIDKYYMQLLKYRSDFKDGILDSETAINELYSFRDEVFSVLTKERLEPDESFLILLKLYEGVKNEIK